MALAQCKSCGKVFDTEIHKGTLCYECLHRIEKLYNKLHEFIRNDGQANFDIDYLADMVNVSPAEIRELIRLGYIERDMQTYGKGPSQRQILALKFTEAMDRLNVQAEIATASYGGKIYKRKDDKNKNRNK